MVTKGRIPVRDYEPDTERLKKWYEQTLKKYEKEKGGPEKD